jgi:hypothetical protein
MSQGPIISRAYGFNGYVSVFPQPIVTTFAPTNGTDQALNGQIWIDTTNQDGYIMVDSTTSTWIGIGGGAGNFANLTVTPGPTSLTGALTTISGAQATNIATDNAAGAINIGTAGVRALIMGSTAALATTTLQTGTGAMTFTAGGIFDVNATGEVTVDTAAGISLDAAAASNFTATGAFDITVSSTAGSINVLGGEAATDAVFISASNATGGITLDAGVVPGIRITNGTQTAQLLIGAGNPNGSVTGLSGSLYIRTGTGSADTTLYVNTDAVSGTAWTALTST